MHGDVALRATVTVTGTVVLTPETGSEAFALKCWSERAVVDQRDEARNESFHYRGSSVVLDLSAFPETFQGAPLTPDQRKEWEKTWRKPSGWSMP